MRIIPKEEDEGKFLAQWLRLNKYKFTHIGNEAGQYGSKNIIIMMKKKQAQGVSKGFPDYCIILKRGALLFIELKRQKKILKSGKIGASPSIVSKEQKEWIAELEKLENVAAEICYGAEESIKLIQDYEKIK